LKTQFSDLSVLASTSSDVDPTELLQLKFPQLLESLRNSYDLVLVDTPPVLPVSDARIVAGWMDAVVIVLASGEESPGGLTETIKRLGMAHAKVKGFVINKAASTGEGSKYYRLPGATFTPRLSQRARS
jgi:receptor protein-tyrosine kinase